MEFENASAESIARGCEKRDGAWVCLYCGRRFELGEVFACEGRLLKASRAAESHVRTAHPDRLGELFALGGKYLSLTDHQRELFRCFASGLSDAEIARQMGVTPSTVRRQRFTFRERAKSAKLFLAAWQIAEENKDDRAALLPIHKEATMVDDRYIITEEENRKILSNVFESLEPLRLKVFSSKEKKKIAILRRIAAEFEAGREYTEKEVNAILMAIYPDFATIRRYLVEYGYMDRTPDCRAYWKK